MGIGGWVNTRYSFTVERLGKGERSGSFTHAGRPAEKIGVGDPPGHNRPLKEPDGSRLPYHITKRHCRIDPEDG